MTQEKKETYIKWAVPGNGNPEGYDGPAGEESPEQAKARQEFLAQYGDAISKSPEVDEYGDPIDGDDDIDPNLLDAANVMADPKATAEEREVAREVLLEAPGLEEFSESYDDDTDVPTDKAEYQKMIADAVRAGNQPVSEYGPDDSAERTQRAIRSVAVESALQRKVNQLLGTPGYQNEGRSADEIKAIAAVRAAMLRQQGIESADLDGPPELSDREAANNEIFGTPEELEQETRDMEQENAEYEAGA